MKRKFLYSTLIILAVLLIAAELIIQKYEKSLVDQVYFTTESQLSSKVMVLESIIERNFHLMVGIEAFVVSGHLSEHGEEEVAVFLKTLYQGANSSALNMYIAPEGVVKYLYPEAGNEALANWDLIHDPRPEIQLQLQQAYETREMTVSGPFQLIQGSSGIVTRKAIYENSRFWGFVSVGLDLDNIMNQSGFEAGAEDLKVAIRIPGEQAFYGDDHIFQQEHHLRSNIELAKINWEIAALPNSDSLKAVFEQVWLVRGMSFAALLMAFATYYMVIHQRENLRAMVHTRTQELQLSNEELTMINSELVKGEEELREQYILLDEYTIALRESEQRLSYLAYYDVLTGISNRAAFQAELKELLSLQDSQVVSASIIFFDLDNFKIVNDTYGHQIGDQLLKDVANRIVDQELPVRMFARFGGDEFAILVTGLQQQVQVQQFSELLLELFKEPFFLAERLFFVAPSIGISQYPSGGTTIEAMLKNADIAMYMAKREGGNGYKFYNQSMESDSLEKLEMGNHLRQAMERGELEIHYQPQIDVLLGKVIGIEALLRWKHTSKGYISPAFFIPLAEEMNLIMPIGEWVMRKACEQMKEFQDTYKLNWRLSVNLSVKQLQDKHVVEKVRNVLAETGLNPQYLELEITENVAMKDEQFDVLRDLRELGVTISVDDFGTHYSSLSYLKRFPVTKIKLDQSFVRGIQTDSKDRAMIRAIIYVAQSFDLEIIAEGVESAEQVSFLMDNGCMQIQGYYFYKPMELSKISGIITDDLSHKVAINGDKDYKI